MTQHPVVTDSNGFRFVLYPFLEPKKEQLLDRHSTTGQNAALAMLIRPGDVVFDVGAHVGRFSVFVERLPGFRGSIYAFEPVPQSFATLQENLQLNGSARVTAFPLAISDQPRRVTMNLFPPHLSSWNSMGWPVMTAAGESMTPSGRVEVDGESIDHFCAARGIERIHFLKVDVEGFEKAVFQGADRMLRERRIDHICFEISQEPLRGAGVTARDVFAVLEAVGYTCYQFDENFRRFVGPLHDSREYWANYYASCEPLPAVAPAAPTPTIAVLHKADPAVTHRVPWHRWLLRAARRAWRKAMMR